MKESEGFESEEFSRTIVKMGALQSLDVACRRYGMRFSFSILGFRGVDDDLEAVEAPSSVELVTCLRLLA